MKRYESPTARIVSAMAAVGMAIFTIGVLVVLPAKLESSAILADTPAAARAEHVAHYVGVANATLAAHEEAP